VPTEVGLVVCDLLSEHFPSVVDLEFTAKMEEKLDGVEENEADWIRVTDAFYKPFSETLAKAEKVAEKIVIEDEPVGEPCPECGTELVIKSGALRQVHRMPDVSQVHLPAEHSEEA